MARGAIIEKKERVLAKKGQINVLIVIKLAILLKIVLSLLVIFFYEIGKKGSIDQKEKDQEAIRKNKPQGMVKVINVMAHKNID